jgi:hypothetical protein
MAQEEEGEDDLELEIVTDDKVTSQSATPQTNGKRSREESSAGEDENSKRVKGDDADDADEDNYDLEEVA